MKKTISILLALVVLTACALPVFAADAEKQPEKLVGQMQGVVKEIQDYYNASDEIVVGQKYILIENADGGTANFLVDATTCLITGSTISQIKVGDTVTGYYDHTLPMILIYPPQYNAIAMAVNKSEDDFTIKVDKFDDQLISQDQDLKLNITEKTPVVKQDGSVYDGKIANKYLAVTYETSTKSIPAQTSPTKVIVMDYQGSSVAPIPPVSVPGQIVVMDKVIDAPNFYVKENNVVMVPLRAITEALGYQVSWDQTSSSVLLNANVSLKIGEDSYSFGRMAPIQLGEAPELKDGYTFVPLTFFKTVLNMNNAYYFEGQVVIDNNEEQI